jgi:osmotically-inducible protein OsmY
MEELKWDASLNHEAIGVSVKDGIVTLSGTIPTYVQKSGAEKATLRVAGVTAVVEHLVVKPTTGYSRGDADIAHAVVHVFKWNTLVPDTVHAVVNDGIVTLKGEVQWNFQREAAEKAARPLLGVRGIKNLITLKSVETYNNIKERIRHAIQRARNPSIGDIRVDVEGSTVTLKGKVRTFAEREAAENAAWSAPGVLKVKDNILVNLYS